MCIEGKTIQGRSNPQGRSECTPGKSLMCKAVLHDLHNIIIVDQSIPAVGYISRNTPFGPEQDLVNRFLSIYLRKLHNNSFNYLVFLEPHIDSGYPDIVVVKYTNAKDCLWSTDHFNLSRTHFKVLFEINRNKTISIKRLSQQTGIEQDKLIRIVNMLVKCNLAIERKRSVQRVPMKDYYCIKQIISFEAKISKWSEAISQALINTRFATESYVLMKGQESPEKMVSRCKELGIGIYLMGDNLHKDLIAYKQNQPLAYTSYWINELVMRIERNGVKDKCC